MALRLIQETPEAAFQIEGLSDARLVNEIPFSRETLAAFWKLKNLRIENRTARSHGVLLTITDGRSEVAAKVRIDAETVDVIEVIGSTPVGRAFLEWAGPGQKFSEDRRISIENTSGRKSLWFFPGTHPLWVGTIAGLRVIPAGKTETKLRLHALRELHLEMNPDRLDQAVAEDWQISLGQESRPARLGAFGRPLTWEIDAEVGDLLEFAVGLQQGLRAETRFEIRIKGGGEGHEAPIWSRTLDPAQGQGDRWFEQTLPLPITRAGPVVLEFSTSSADQSNQALGMPVWGSPMIVRHQPSPAVDGTDFNILLISIDTLRADHVSAYGYERNTTPNLDRWAATRGVVFENTVASSPWTLPSHYSMFSGLDALNHGINHGLPTTSVPLIAEFFSDRGFSTVAQTGGGFLHPRYGLSRGCDSYLAQYSHGDSEELERGVDGLIDWLGGHQDRRFFALLHTYEVHGPYRARRPFVNQWRSVSDGEAELTFSTRPCRTGKDSGYVKAFDLAVSDGGSPVRDLQDDELQLAVDYYDAGIAYADDQFGRLFEYLEAQGLFENTIVIVTSDHGEALGEKGLAGHAYLYDFSIMVPLMISVPGLEHPGLRVPRQVRLVDLTPTILDLAGFEAPEGLDGVSLAPLMRGEEAAVPEHAWTYAAKTNYGLGLRVANRLKYTFNNTAWTPAQGVEELFMLGNDPEESENQAEADPATESLRRTLVEQLLKDERGLVIEVNNQSDSVLRADLSLSQDQKLIIAKIKGAGIPADAVQVVNGKTLALRAPPASRFTIVAEDVLTDSLHIKGSNGNSWTSTLDTTIDLSGADARGMPAFEKERWTMVDEA
ncbi:MAG: sulfatase-like hydrolase/transferase, partial [Acidobacteriota bacterium]